MTDADHIAAFAGMSLPTRWSVGVASLEWLLEEPIRSSLNAALRGELDAWPSLAAALPADAYGTLLRLVWQGRHSALTGIGNARLARVRELIAGAGFDTTGLPEQMMIYRGVAGLNVDEGAAGLSWSVSEPTAWLFARGLSARRGRPLVLVAKVSRADVIAFFDDRPRGLREVITDRPVPQLSLVSQLPEPSRAAKRELDAYWDWDRLIAA